jgi:hypothetical protein
MLGDLVVGGDPAAAWTANPLTPDGAHSRSTTTGIRACGGRQCAMSLPGDYSPDWLLQSLQSLEVRDERVHLGVRQLPAWHDGIQLAAA